MSLVIIIQYYTIAYKSIALFIIPETTLSKLFQQHLPRRPRIRFSLRRLHYRSNQRIERLLLSGYEIKDYIA